MNDHAFSRKTNIVPLRQKESLRTNSSSVAKKSKSSAKQSPFFLRVFLFVMCACMLYMGWNYYKLMGEVSQQKSELGILQKRVAESKIENESLQHQKKILNSDAFIEKIAREELGMIKDGEIIMKVDSEDNK